MWIRPKSLRARLTLSYLSVFAALLIFAWGGTFVLVFFQLRSQLDHFNVEEIETVEGLLYLDPDGNVQVREDYHNHPESKDRIESFLEVRSMDGAVLFRNDRLGERDLGGALQTEEGVGGYSERSASLSDGTPVRLVSRAHVLEGRNLVIRLAHSEEAMLSRIQELVIASLLMLPFVLAAAALAGYALVRRALSPIDQMVNRAQQITPERLSERLPNAEVDDEFGRLARVFNDTLARLERAFTQLRQFTSDCSHELRTPLAMIRSIGEVGLQKDGSREEYREIVGSMLEEVNRLTSLIDNLLTISRADAGSFRLRRAIVPVMALAREAAGLFEVLMEEKSLRLVLDGDECLEVEGDNLFLRQALVNVIHNAVKYSPDGDTIFVRVNSEGAALVTVEIQDHGPGIPAEDGDRVFERFYRVDKSRHRDSGGAGLGLSIAKWAVEAHGGHISLLSVVGKGCTFQIRLPRLQQSPAKDLATLTPFAPPGELRPS